MEKIQVFQNAEFGEIRTVIINNEPWFVGKDVAEALGFTNSRDAIATHVFDDDKGVEKIDTRGGKQNMTVISESGLYALVFGSRLESAKRFKHWVTAEVLPAIRRHGAYMTEDNARMKPKEIFADAVAASNTSILIGELAKLLSQNGYVTGQNRLFTILRDRGYLIKSGTSKNMPTQSSMERGLFEIKETIIHNPDGSIRINKTPKVTGKGQQYFINKFLYERKKDGNSNNEDIERSSTDHRSIL